MINFEKYSKILPYVAWKLNLYPLLFDNDDFVDIKIEYLEYSRIYLIEFYYNDSKYRGNFVYRNDFYSHDVKNKKHVFVLKSKDTSFMMCNDFFSYKYTWRDLPKLCHFWHDYVNDSFYNCVTS